MEQFSVGEWSFSVDREKTAQYYAGQKSKYVWKRCPASLKDFIDRLGVDLAKPVEVYGACGECVFAVVGTAASPTGYELDFLEGGLYLSVVIYPEDACGLEGNSHIFSIGIVGYSLLVDG